MKNNNDTWNVQSLIDAIEAVDAESARDMQQVVDQLPELEVYNVE